MKNIVTLLLSFLFLNQAFSQDDKNITVSQFKDKSSKKKHALVMGKAAYEAYEPLGSPKTDADKMSAF